MSLLRRSLAIVVALLVGTLGFGVVPAHADTAQAIKAADYIVTTFNPGDDKPFGEVGAAADSLIALAATGDPKYTDQIIEIVTFLQANTKAYIGPKSGGTSGAAKLAVAAAAVKLDATNFGGVDLVAEVTKGVQADGSFGSFPGPFSSGLGMLALARNNAPIPEAMVDYLITYQQPRSGTEGGGFGCTPFPFGTDCPQADADSTALAILGLDASGSAKAVAAAATAREWLTGTQQADGSWAGYSPVNSTGMVGPLFGAGSEQAKRAEAYVAGKQLPSGALSTGADTEPNLIATQQGIFALAGLSYATIGLPAPAPSPSGSTPASPGPVLPAAPSGTDPAVVWTVGGLLVVAVAGMAVAATRARRS